MPSTVPFIDPRRRRARIRPIKAFRHMQRLLADKEDTRQVFEIIDALNGDSLRRDFRKFMARSNGQTLLQHRRYLPDILDDHDTLMTLPANSVARAYIKFMRREKLSAAGLVAESETQRRNSFNYDDDLTWFANRGRDTHDLMHVLTGYGRDGLGEAALLAYTYKQHGGFGINFISMVGQRQIRRSVPASIDIGSVFAEARAHGKAAYRIIDQDIPLLLREPLDAARQRLNIKKPVAYRDALASFDAIGLSDTAEAA